METACKTWLFCEQHMAQGPDLQQIVQLLQDHGGADGDLLRLVQQLGQAQHRFQEFRFGIRHGDAGAVFLRRFARRPHPEHEVRQDLPVQIEEEGEERLSGSRIEKGRRAGHVDAGDQELAPPEDEFLRADERAFASLDDDGHQRSFEAAVRCGRVLPPDEHQTVDGAGADLRGGEVPHQDVFQGGKDIFFDGQG